MPTTPTPDVVEADFVVKQHDTWPPIQVALSDQLGTIDLSTATQVKFLASSGLGGHDIDGICNVTNASVGELIYTWVTGDTQYTGDYEVEFEITWNDGTIETVPNDSYGTLVIVADLG